MKLRKEDKRFLLGRGTYTSDISISNMHHISFVRSTLAHAHIRGMDIKNAFLEGVVGIYVHADLDPELGEVPMVWPLEGLQNPGHPLLASKIVRYIGEPIAVIVATTEWIARRAASCVKVHYEPLPSIDSLEQALQSDEPIVEIHSGIPTNRAYSWHREYGTRSSIEESDHVLTQRYIIPRVVPLPLETRAVLASYDAVSDTLHVTSSTQFQHVLRLAIATALGHSENRVQVTCPDVGGAFGSKMNVYREEILVPYLSKKLRLNLRYIESRYENFIATTHGRDQIQDVKVYYSKEGRVVGIEAVIHASMGAYLQAATPGIPIFTTRMLSGCYHIPYIKVTVVGHYTNQMSTDAYRGAGRPEATYLLERSIDMIARKLGRDPVEVRKLNFIKKEDFPKEVVTGLIYDSGDYELALDKAIELLDIDHWRNLQMLNRVQGSRKQIGIGFSSYVEFCGSGPSKQNALLGLMTGGFESAVVRMHPTGAVSVISGTCPAGQGHQTSWAILVERMLGVPYEQVEIHTGQTMNAPWGSGTFGSRSAAVGGSAIHQACEKIIAKGRKYLSDIWRVLETDITYEHGVYRSNLHEMGITAVAGRLYLAHDLPLGMEPGLEGTVFYEPSNFTFPFGTHICVVEIDLVTGVPTILLFVAVDDCGEIIHEQIVKGQVRGGIVQGIGQALYEAVIQDAEGLKSHSFRTYHAPRSIDIPPMIIERTCTPSPSNPLGVKGVGESGAIGSTAAIINAIIDALAPYGVEHIDLPATPERIWHLLNRSN